MTDSTASPSAARIPSLALIPFVILTFTITWGLVGFYIFRLDQAAALLGELSGTHPAFIVATWGPAISAFILIALIGGAGGFRRYISRLSF